MGDLETVLAALAQSGSRYWVAADGFSQHEAEQLERWRKLTPQQRLRWLDEAKQFAAKVEAARLQTQAADPRDQKT